MLAGVQRGIALLRRLLTLAVLLHHLVACGGGSASSSPAGKPPADWTTPAAKAPRVSYQVFQSTAANARVSFHVYLPPGYEVSGKRYPVLYWLHGTGAGVTGIPAVAERFDRAMQAGAVPQMIIVFPNGLASSMWTDSKDGTVPMETVVVQELLPHVDRSFRTLGTRQGRLIEGFSMGGFGAARIAFKYPQLFAAASMLGAGPLQATLARDIGPPVNAQERENVLRDVFGNDQAYFQATNPRGLASRNASLVRGMLPVRQITGTADFSLADNREFRTHLLELGIPVQYTEVAGATHSVPQLIEGMGAAFWRFHAAALGAAAR